MHMMLNYLLEYAPKEVYAVPVFHASDVKRAFADVDAGRLAASTLRAALRVAFEVPAAAVHVPHLNCDVNREVLGFQKVRKEPSPDSPYHVLADEIVFNAVCWMGHRMPGVRTRRNGQAFLERCPKRFRANLSNYAYTYGEWHGPLS
eukprot:TRINITY_DN57751_c0_g1_i1.p2 TRINITY_DN57751_c0_g1~~TRINITY_DN57751_c0_g1_i1.p2  ORF type:complete len:147 (+),score=23.56 TRINITY_DN57751_c0_g1_i1:85-525(+)